MNQLPAAAVKIPIAEILVGEFIATEGAVPSYIQTRSQKKVSRVNVIGALLDRETLGTVTSFLIDDGSGQIRVRCFTEPKHLQSMKVGDVVVIIGRIREYNNERYISPEIIRPVDKKWLKVRALEWVQENDKPRNTMAETPQKAAAEEQSTVPALRLVQLISELDRGEGVPVDEVMEKSPLTNTGDLLQKLVESGEIFYNIPGKVKVL